MDVKCLINWAVKQYPDNTAVVYGGKGVTFSDVNLRVNRLANTVIFHEVFSQIVQSMKSRLKSVRNLIRVSQNLAKENAVDAIEY